MADSHAFPWIRHLPEEEQRQFFEELSNAIGEAQLHSMPGVLVTPEAYASRLDPLIAAWKATAEVHADPELKEALTRPSGFDGEDFEEVRDPRTEMHNKIRAGLSDALNLSLGQLHAAEDAILARIFEEPVPEAPKKPARRCGASLPDADGDNDWHYCIKPENHAGAHESYAKDGPSTFWRDGDSVEITWTEEVFAVPNHVHDYVGDSDDCQTAPNCPLTWRAASGWAREWEIQDVSVPKPREGE